MSPLSSSDQPDVMVLTETHLRAREKKKDGSRKRSEDTRPGRPATLRGPPAGVIVAIKEHLAVLGRATSHTTHALDGRLVHVTLKLPHSAPLAISGVYAPADTTQEAMEERDQLYKHLTEHAERDKEQMGNTVSLLAGD
jgi:exonuclease III